MQVQKLRLVIAALVIAAGVAGVAGAVSETGTVVGPAVVADGGGHDDTPWD
jgi:hypothetical protein